MKRALLCAAFVLACGKKDEAPAAAKPSPSSSASVESDKPAPPAKKNDDKTTYKGSYTAKQAEVRTPDDAPKFIHPDSKDALGAGELELNVDNGIVTGKATGALGAQTVSGALEDGHLRATLTPTDGAMWGVLDADVAGSSIKGSIRASGRDGRVVREATFALEKK